MTRTKYMQELMSSTYPSIAIEAIKTKFDGAWERLIAEQLREDFIRGHSEAEVLLQSISDPVEPLNNTCLKVAYLITHSKIKPCHT